MLPTQQYSLYPDIVQHTVHVRYNGYPGTSVATGFLIFFLNGERHTLSITDLCKLYDFDEIAEWTELPTLPDVGELWHLMATDPWEFKESKQTNISRHVLRYVVKVISNTIQCKDETSKIRMQKLATMEFSIHHLRGTFYHGDRPTRAKHGDTFAHHFETIKMRLFRGRTTKTVGNLLTLIFLFCRVRRDRMRVVHERKLIHMRYLISARSIKNPCQFIFTTVKCNFCITLPQMEYTSMMMAQGISFWPPVELCMLHPGPRPNRRCGTRASSLQQ